MRSYPSIGHPCPVSEWHNSSLLSIGHFLDGDDETCGETGNFEIVVRSAVKCFKSAQITIATKGGINCNKDLSVAIGSKEGAFLQCEATVEETNQCCYNCTQTVTAMLYVRIAIYRHNTDRLALCEITFDHQ